MPLKDGNKRVTVALSIAEFDILSNAATSAGFNTVGQYLLVAGREKFRLESTDRKQNGLSAPLA